MVDSVKGRMGVQLSNDHLFFSVGMPTLNGLTNEINWMQKETMILQHAAALLDKHQLHHDLLELKRGLSEIYTQRSLFFYDRLLATLNIILDAQSIARMVNKNNLLGILMMKFISVGYVSSDCSI